ncbi:hypothetical protein TNCV_526671 [Trichonephila clavipes]|nr:hypothetical protein TNCV_526671 [Trichonephila clavipes]
MPREGAFHHLIIVSYPRQDKRSKGNGCAIQHDFMLLIVRLVQQKNKKCKIASVTENFKLGESRNMAFLVKMTKRCVLYVLEQWYAEDCRKYGGTDIVRSIKASRIRWLGHLYRYTKKVTFSKIEGTRRRERPPTRWLDDVEKDLKQMGIN